MREYRKRRAPYGFVFLDSKATLQLQEKTRKASEILLQEGFNPVMPASVDYPETFEGYESHDFIRFRDHLGEDLSLRSDATVQVIKGFSNLLETENLTQKEHLFFYNVQTFRDVKKSYPSLREINQIGVEKIGIEAERAIPRLVELANRILQEVFSVQPLILLGDIRLFLYLQKYLHTDDLAQVVRGKNAPLLQSALVEQGWPADQAAELARLLLFSPDREIWLERWQALFAACSKPRQQVMTDLFKMLEPLFALADSLAQKGIAVRSEPLLLRKVMYYTGLIFEGYVEHLSFPPLRGGAYDNLVSEYSNMQLPASGFALDVSPIA